MSINLLRKVAPVVITPVLIGGGFFAGHSYEQRSCSKITNSVRNFNAYIESQKSKMSEEKYAELGKASEVFRNYLKDCKEFHSPAVSAEKLYYENRKYFMASSVVEEYETSRLALSTAKNIDQFIRLNSSEMADI